MKRAIMICFLSLSIIASMGMISQDTAYAGDVYRYSISNHYHNRYMINGYPVSHGGRYVIAPYAEERRVYIDPPYWHHHHHHHHHHHFRPCCVPRCKCVYPCYGCGVVYPPVGIYVPGPSGWYLQFGVSGGF